MSITFKNNLWPGTVIGLLIFSICLLLIILLCLRRRKVKTELVDKVAYNSRSSECEIRRDKNAAYHTNYDDIVTATNAAYAAVPSTSGDNNVDITTSPNEAYASTDIATSVNAVYEPVKNDTPPVKSNTLQYDYVPVLM